MQPNATIYLLVGPVGAGKTTWAERRAAARGGLVLDLDAWMVRLFGADERPATTVIAWYLERRERCRALVWDLASATVAAGCSVYVELRRPPAVTTTPVPPKQAKSSPMARERS